MAKMTKQSKKAKWEYINPLNRSEPAAEITQASVLAFRNGLRKFVDSNKEYQKNMASTIVYRCIIDLDHLARIMEANNSTLTFQYVITPKDKASVKAMVKEVQKKGASWKRSSR